MWSQGLVTRKYGDRGDSGDFHPNRLFDPADFSLGNQLLASEYSEFPLIKLAVGAVHPLHWGHCEFCICLHRVCETLKIWAKFNASRATKKAITKNHSLCTWQQRKMY